MSKMGKKLKEAQDEYTNLISTRRTQLERPLRKIEEIRDRKDFPEAEIEEGLEDEPEIQAKETKQIQDGDAAETEQDDDEMFEDGSPQGDI